MRGEVTIEVLTDRPEERFVLGGELITDPKDRGPLRIETIREHNGVLLLSFAGRGDRNSVESLRNTYLMADIDIAAGHDEDEFHISQILGCTAFNVEGEEMGEVIDVLALPAQDTLVIERNGEEFLVPFVKHHVPDIDISARKITISNLVGLI